MATVPTLPAFAERYLSWLHLRWPAGRVERLPVVGTDGLTNVPGVRVAGDLAGVPLLKFAADTGVRAVRAFAAERDWERTKEGDAVFDVAIVGGGVAGIAAALEAKRLGLRFAVFETADPFSTIVNFPKGKPIFTYPTDFKPEGELTLAADVKEALVAELEAQRRAAGIETKRARIERVERDGDVIRLHHPGGAPFRARRVLVAIGRSGDFRKLGVPGEVLDKVTNRLHDPADHRGKRVLVVGGGDSAVEAALALAEAGASVALSYRGGELNRPKPENVERVRVAAGAGKLELRLGTEVERITPESVVLKPAKGAPGGGGGEIANDAVFVLIGREAPLEFFRRSGIRVAGETGRAGWWGLAAMLVLCVFVYTWKSGGPIESWLNPAWWADGWQAAATDRSTLIGTLVVSMESRSFYYTLLYSLCILVFGIDRMRRRRTPYVRVQTVTLMLFQWIPLFILPELLLPWAGYNGVFSGGGAGEALGDALFEKYIPVEAYAAGQWPEWGHPRAYWRAYGFILAWPLNVYNTFTASPHWWWLAIGFVQTFVVIPLLVWRYGKGAYCGWICSCGALAETMGDRHRTKMPHGPEANRWNVVGQIFLAAAAFLLVVRVVGWIWPGGPIEAWFSQLLEGKNAGGGLSPVFFLSYKWIVDILAGGILGVGLYFKYSGRVWCRFACPLAALMHIYARFTRFRIFADKKKCISCNVCTSVCHQGIDIQSFANKGLPMEDPQCVRCSACVQSCPTGVLTFGYVRSDGSIAFDKLAAKTV